MALRRRNASLATRNAQEAETGAPTAENRLRHLAGANVSESAIQVAHTAGRVLYPKTFDKMPDDVLVSLIERAPVYESHGITTRKDFEGFFARSLAETFAPVLGRLGYLPTLPLAANYIAPHLELPLTGYSTGGPTMFMTVNTMAFEEGLRKYYIGQLDTQHLPLSVQSRYDDFRKNAVPPEVLTEMYRQIPRVMTTLIPAFNAMRKGELLNQKAVVLNDVYADSASFAFADLIPVVATAVSETMFKNHADAGRGLEAPTHGELIAHQPIDILEHRLSNHEKGWFKSIGEAGNAMTKGLGELWTTRERLPRTVLVPANAGSLISVALVVTAFTLDKFKNPNHPAGEIDPKLAAAVPLPLVYMEVLATLAFGKLLEVCDNAITKGAPRREYDTPAMIEEVTGHRTDADSTDGHDVAVTEARRESSRSEAHPEPLMTAAATSFETPGSRTARPSAHLGDAS
ncbi:hypothetical protein PQR05_08940 [Paraburkholderia sediminicola]|uniref:hypothetical protein n=1 Tax=Paraburkholderia sediminicola TaxID=458836 RepID=UPI0038BC4B7D